MERSRLGWRQTRHTGFALLAIGLVGVLATAGVASAQIGHKKKGLSLSSITITDGTSANGTPVWVAIGEGYFKKLGLNVSLINSGTGSANTVAILVSGSTNFLQLAAGAQIIAAQAGGPIRALLQTSTGEPQEIVITTSFAQAHGIPLTASTPNAVLAQFLALKGTHANIAISNSAATGYGWILGMAAKHGLTVGFTSGSSADINLVTVGTPAAEVAALAAGKVDGFSNSPPTTVVTSPPVVTLSIYEIPPASSTAAVYLSTTTAMIANHPDTVQAVVTAVEQGAIFVKTHPKQAEHDTAAQLATVGITSPEESQYLFAIAYAQFDKNPYPTKKAYNAEVAFLNEGNPAPITLSASTMIDTRFAAVANRQLGLPIPK